MRGVRNGKRKHIHCDAPSEESDDHKRQRHDKDKSNDKLGDQVRNATIIPHDKYYIGWICALDIELTAATAMLDVAHGPHPQPENDINNYTLGSISGHNVVIACLPFNSYGTNTAAIVATHMRRTFSSICVWLLVGIGGGVPGKVDIRLGDIVVSTRVLQSDLGKIEKDGQLHQTGLACAPSQGLMTAVATMKAKHRKSTNELSRILQNLREGPYMTDFASPGVKSDLLFDSNYEHESLIRENCNACDRSRLVPRNTRVDEKPMVHYGIIASSNQLIRHARTRDQVVQIADNICFEMEAAGLMDSYSSLVIRGISDYSDSHKNKQWQGYAAAAAAAYAKELLSIIPLKERQESEIRRGISTTQGVTARHSRNNSPDTETPGKAHRIKDIKAGQNAKLVFHSDDSPLNVSGVSAGDNAIEFFGSGGHLLLRELLHGPIRAKAPAAEETVQEETAISTSNSKSRS